MFNTLRSLLPIVQKFMLKNIKKTETVIRSFREHVTLPSLNMPNTVDCQLSDLI